MNGDGLITVNELATFLKHEITVRSQHRVNPLFADLIPLGSRGGFFFLTKDAKPGKIEESSPSKHTISFGTKSRFITKGPYSVLDQTSGLEWTLLSQGAPANWKTATKWCRQSDLRLPSTEELMTLTSENLNEEQPIIQLLSLYSPHRAQIEFWANSRKGFSREVLKMVDTPPEIDVKNPEDKCGVIAIAIQ
ncbi:DUF1566 domain-containing protein [Verrucomicrobia bacterium]|jgi:hypothetical protein|nr:DUF1566 domain-containing protein [Verrucomicrobiota bacterium]MDA7657508.1 DUF1566 domain-containing protein [Verrucomicrobiota bacterium]MDB4746287.1 DUF1566 domain-containing protein [Verrucomicrobiota bacterium]